MIAKFYTIILFMVSCNYLIFSQDYSPYICPVIVEGEELKYPFTGGFNAPQFSNIDLNQDGILDLFVYDRIGDVPMFFEYEGQGLSSSYNYKTEYKHQMPPNMCCWALFEDYNNDGIEDLFTVPGDLGVNGYSLYQGTSDNGQLSFELRRMGGTEQDLPLVWFTFGVTAFPVIVPFNDVPDIVDIDFDGDLDVLSFELDGSFIYYYKNLQVEQGLPADTMVYELGDQCFGKIRESGLSEALFLSDNPEVCAENFRLENEEIEKHNVHSGSAVLALDHDDDNDMDLLVGDLTNPGLVFLENGGSAEQNWMTRIDTFFPEYDIPVEMSIFLGAYNVDVNGDNLKDLLVSPNQKSSITNTNNIWYYENTGDPVRRFSLKSRNFLGDQTLDFGSYSYPVFVDYNADGLQDIVVTTDGEFGTSGPAELAMYLFENTGTKSEPVFELVDDDYLGFRAFSSTSRNPAPSFGDLDGDSDLDLLIGDNNGKLYFFENTAGPGQMLEFKTPVYNYMDIDDGQDAKPEIVDLNRDGLGDIVIGNRISEIQDGTVGSLRYYQNQGTIGSPVFVPDASVLPNTLVLGEVDVRTSTSGGESILSAPCIIQLEDKYAILVGSDSKGISLYTDIENNFYDAFTFEGSDLGQLVEGRAITVDAYDIDNDGYLEFLIGNRRGGISFYNSDLESEMVSTMDLSSNEQKMVFPNPTSGVLTVNPEYRDHIEEITVYNLFGQRIAQFNQGTSSLNLTEFDAGAYIIIIATHSGQLTQKIIKI